MTPHLNQKIHFSNRVSYKLYLKNYQKKLKINFCSRKQKKCDKISQNTGNCCILRRKGSSLTEKNSLIKKCIFFSMCCIKIKISRNTRVKYIILIINPHCHYCRQPPIYIQAFLCVDFRNLHTSMHRCSFTCSSYNHIFQMSSQSYSDTSTELTLPLEQLAVNTIRAQKSLL